jgi:hypothetical protein
VTIGIFWFRFFPKDVGGIFRRGDSIVIGSAKGEKVVKANQFICEKVVDGTLFGNHLIVVIPDDIFAFVPIWIGSGSDQPESQAARIEWAFGNEDLIRSRIITVLALPYSSIVANSRRT